MIDIIRHWQASIILSITCVVIWLGVILSIGPRVEAKFFPPFSEISYRNVERDGNLVCWKMHLHKVRPARLISSAYWLETNYTRTPLVVYLGGDTVAIGAPIEPGPPIDIGTYCAELPTIHGTVMDGSRGRIINVRVYQSALCCWDFVYLFPPLSVPQ